jgi:hypothetical protein
MTVIASASTALVSQLQIRGAVSTPLVGVAEPQVFVASSPLAGVFFRLPPF